AFGTEDRQTPYLLHARPEFDVGTATGHVRGDGDGALLARLRHDQRLLLGPVSLRVQDVVLDPSTLQHATERLRDLHRRRTDEDGLTLGVVLVDLLDDGVVLLSLRAEYEVVEVLALYRHVRRDDDDVQAI